MALFLAGFLVVLLANLFPGSVAAMRRAESSTQALNLAESVLAEEMAKPYATLEVGTTTLLEPVTSQNRTFHPLLEVYEVAGRDVNYLKGLRVIISWREGKVDRKVQQEVWIANLNR
jgi:hypothetical protein